MRRRRRLPQGNGGDCPTRKTPHRAPPPCEELDPASIFLLFFHCLFQVIIYRRHRKLDSFSSKNNKNCCHQSCTFDSNMHQIVCRLRLRPDPTGGGYSAPPEPLAIFRGPVSKGRKGGSSSLALGRRKSVLML